MGSPKKQGLYDPRHEHDACGVGFIANIKGAKSHDIVTQGLQILINLDHRGAVGADPLLGDGAGILIQIPDGLLRAWARGSTGTSRQPINCWCSARTKCSNWPIATSRVFSSCGRKHMATA